MLNIDTTELMGRRDEIMLRIHERVVVEDRGYDTPCHIWTGADSGQGRGGGYGRMSLNGQTVATHIVVYTHFFGYVPGKKQIDHKCNQRLCCNPYHLEMVSHLRNQRLRAQRAKENQ